MRLTPRYTDTALLAALMLEAALYSLLPPLLPRYADALGLSPARAGLLVGAYTAGVLLGAAPGSWLYERTGPRVMGAAVGILGGASIASAGSATFAALIAWRLIQGAAGGVLWGAALRWIGRAVPAKRTRLFALAFGAAAFGTGSGPTFGAVAAWYGPVTVWVTCGAAALVLAVVLMLAPPVVDRERERVPVTLVPPSWTSVTGPVWLVTAVSLPLGLVSAVMPTRLTELWGSDRPAVVALSCAGVVGLLASLAVGGMVYRWGLRLPLGIALQLTAPCLAAMAIVTDPFIAAYLVVVYVGALYAISLPPAVQLVSDAVEAGPTAWAGPVLAMAAIALGETIGAAGGGALAGLSLGVPCAVLAVVVVTTGAAVVTDRRTR